MKVTIDRAALNEALSAASTVALNRTPKPILQSVRLTAAKDRLTVTAYDQEVGLRYHVVEVETNKAGETLIPCKRFMDIIRESSDETMAIESDEDHLHIRGRDSHFEIIGQSVREFPPVPDKEGEPDFLIKIGHVQDTITKTLFAAARETTRYAINGVLWEKTGKRLNMVATDGRRLAMKHSSLEKSVGEDRQVIVPSKALGLMARLNLDPDEVLEARLLPNQIILSSSRFTLSSVLVEGHFPKYQDVIPRDLDKKITMSRDVFLSAVRRAALLANAESKGVRLQLEGNTMTVSSRTPEQGQAQIKIEVDHSGSDIVIGFNPEFLIDALKVCDEQITLELKESARPGLIRSGTDFQYVVMPVNLS